MEVSLFSYSLIHLCIKFFLLLILLWCMLQQAGKADFEMLEKKVKEWGEPKVASAKQVMQNLNFV